MPLTKTGSKVMHSMMEEYGSKKGKSVFYASINAKKAGSSEWEGKSHSSKVIGMAKEMIHGK